MPAFKNIAGLRFGRLVALEPQGRANGRVIWRCLCDCGSETIVKGSLLTSGETRSCGCLCRELRVARRTHGQSRPTPTPTYRAWTAMLTRCHNPKAQNYARYGGRGIAVCGRWLSFQKFFEDMGARPSGCDLHRIDNDKGYEPGNCVWLPHLDHMALHRSTRA
jgi:hypothetical protein